MSQLSNQLTYKAALGTMLLQQQLAMPALPGWRRLSQDQKAKALFLAEAYVQTRREEERASARMAATWRKRTKWRPRTNRA